MNNQYKLYIYYLLMIVHLAFTIYKIYLGIYYSLNITIH